MVDGCHRFAVPYLTAYLTTPEVSADPSAVPMGVETDKEVAADVDEDEEERGQRYFEIIGMSRLQNMLPGVTGGNLRFPRVAVEPTGTARA